MQNTSIFLLGLLPMFLPVLGMDGGVGDPLQDLLTTLSKGGVFSAGFFCTLWYLERRKVEEANEKLNDARLELAEQKQACSNCPGNKWRIKALHDHEN